MNADDVVKYGHSFFMEKLEGIPEDECYATGVCGVWSIKDLIAHIASHELVFIDVMNMFLENGEPTPAFDKNAEIGPMEYNDYAVAARSHLSYTEQLDEYIQAYEKLVGLLAQVPVAKRREVGSMPWYGMEYDLEDWIVYGNYAHKREHGAQIDVFKDKLKAEGKVKS